MAYFTTRVELHNAVLANYETLHAAMKAEGFDRTIVGSDGKTYHLPTAEYLKIGNLQKSDVLNSAKRAAAKTGKEYSVLVTEGTALTWYNLPEVK